MTRVVTLGCLGAILVATSWPGGHSLWRLVYAFVPGAQGMRAVGRISLLLLLPLGAAIAVAADDLLEGRRIARSVAFALLFLAALEQVQTLPSYDKRPVRTRVARVAAAVPADCRAFFFSPILPGVPYWETQLDGMWASLAVAKPTVNGYSSNLPPGWTPLMAHALRAAGEPRVKADLDAWMALEHLPSGTVAWVQLPGWEPALRRLPPGEPLNGSTR